MSVRNLKFLFSPRSVALIGASERSGSVGNVLARNLLGQAAGSGDGFDGPIMPVNPKATSVASVAAYPNVASLPVTPDLAVICTPPDALQFRFGENSFFPHLDNARSRGYEPQVVPCPGIGLDIDEPEDLRLFAASVSSTRAYRYLQSIGYLNSRFPGS